MSVVLGIELRALCLLYKHPATILPSPPNFSDCKR